MGSAECRGYCRPFLRLCRRYVYTLTKDRYLNMLKSTFIPALRRKGINIGDIRFQQDWTTPHTTGDLIQWYSKHWRCNLLSFNTDQDWPPHFLDLSLLGVFVCVWGGGGGGRGGVFLYLFIALRFLPNTIQYSD